MSVAERLEQVLVPLKLLYVGRTIFSELVIHNQHRAVRTYDYTVGTFCGTVCIDYILFQEDLLSLLSRKIFGMGLSSLLEERKHLVSICPGQFAFIHHTDNSSGEVVDFHHLGEDIVKNNSTMAFFHRVKALLGIIEEVGGIRADLEAISERKYFVS